MRTPTPTAVVARRVTRVTILTVALASAALLAGACATPRGGDASADSAAAAPGSAATPGAAGAAGGARGEAAPAPSGNARITLELDRTRYAAGGTVNVRIVNPDDASYGFSACQRQVERRRGGEWFSIPEDGRVCTMMLQLVGARQTVMAETELPSPLEAGEYRLVIAFSREDATTPAATPSRVASAPFRVE